LYIPVVSVACLTHPFAPAGKNKYIHKHIEAHARRNHSVELRWLHEKKNRRKQKPPRPFDSQKSFITREERCPHIRCQKLPETKQPPIRMPPIAIQIRAGHYWERGMGDGQVRNGRHLFALPTNTMHGRRCARSTVVQLALPSSSASSQSKAKRAMQKVRREKPRGFLGSGDKKVAGCVAERSNENLSRGCNVERKSLRGIAGIHGPVIIRAAQLLCFSRATASASSIKYASR